MELHDRFTVVFEGDVRRIKGNPHNIVSEFGRPRTVSTGDLVNSPKRDAADDMYEVVRLVVERLDLEEMAEAHVDDFMAAWTEIHQKARAALSKVNGESGE